MMSHIIPLIIPSIKVALFGQAISLFGNQPQKVPSIIITINNNGLTLWFVQTAKRKGFEKNLSYDPLCIMTDGKIDETSRSDVKVAMKCHL